MRELTLTDILASQESQKERIRQELISHASELSRSMARLARRLEEIDDVFVSSLGECQGEPHIIDRLCAVYMEKRDLIHELKGESLI